MKRCISQNEDLYTLDMKCQELAREKLFLVDISNERKATETKNKLSLASDKYTGANNRLDYFKYLITYDCIDLDKDKIVNTIHRCIGNKQEQAQLVDFTLQYLESIIELVPKSFIDSIINYINII